MKKTDWEAYYRLRSNLVTKYSKSVVRRAFLTRLEKYWPAKAEVKVAELGGAHSFFHEPIQRRFAPAEYHIVDSHFFKPRNDAEKSIRFHHKDILHLDKKELEADVILSSGLIEHFGSGTEKAVEAHFRILRPGGIVVMSFPIPSLSYRAVRAAMKKAGAWIFHDEQPLAVKDVRDMTARHGEIVETGILSALPLTQAILVARSRG